MELDLFKQIGFNIALILAKQQRTQQSLANDLGISKQVMHKIMKGSKAINAIELNAIAKALAVSMDTLLPSEGDTESNHIVFGFMGEVACEQTRAEFERVRIAIDEMFFLEDLLNG